VLAVEDVVLHPPHCVLGTKPIL